MLLSLFEEIWGYNRNVSLEKNVASLCAKSFAFPLNNIPDVVWHIFERHLLKSFSGEVVPVYPRHNVIFF